MIYKKTSNYTILRRYIDSFACMRCQGTGMYMDLECDVCEGIGTCMSLSWIISSIMYVMYGQRHD